MKNKIYCLLTAIFLAFSISAFAQVGNPPPCPNNNNTGPTSSNSPVGSSAPIGSGLIILIALGAGYGAKKVYDLKKKRLDDLED